MNAMRAAGKATERMEAQEKPDSAGVWRPGGPSMIVGLGNPLHTDDAVGPRVARLVHELMDCPAIEVCELAAGGIELLEAIVGYRNVVIIDALYVENEKPGICCLLDPEDLPPTRHASMSHEFGLQEGIELGRRLGLEVPERIWIYAVTVSDPFTFGSRMTEAVELSAPHIAREIAAEVRLRLAGDDGAAHEVSAVRDFSMRAPSGDSASKPQFALGGPGGAAHQKPVRDAGRASRIRGCSAESEGPHES